jgi:hypothetical protein
VARPERWFLSSYVTAWLENGQHYTDDMSCLSPETKGATICQPVDWAISSGQSVAVLGTLAACPVVLAAYAFRIRDVR